MPRCHRSALWCLVLASCSGRADAPPGASVAMAVAAAPPSAREPIAPWTLTAADGSGLTLTRVDAKAVLQGPLAFTELHLYFHNPEDRVREGTFSIALPARAAVARFAMEGEHGWLEAEVVDKAKARRAYEDVLHQRQDPALLEKAEGNRFTARVFPIPARGDKHLVVSFSQALPGERYVLALRGLPRLAQLDARIDALGPDGTRRSQALSRRDWLPDRDMVSELPAAVEAVASGTTVVAQVELPAPVGEAGPRDGLNLMIDTSASRALGFAATVQAVHELLREVGKRHDDLLVQVMAFDQETCEIYVGRAADWGDAQDQRLLARGAAGASDLGQALSWLGQHGRFNFRAHIVLITDAVLTAGFTPADVALQLRMLTWPPRVDVLLTGGIRDEAAALQWVGASAVHGVVQDLDAGAAAAARALDEPGFVDVAIDAPEATWVYPRKLAAQRGGTRAMVYARLPAPAQTLDVIVGGVRHTLRPVSATPALVEHTAAAAEIAELEDKLARVDDVFDGPAKQTELRAELARRSVAHRVVSSETALLVLESDADYERYGIDRTALADVMAIGAGGVETLHRALPPPPAPRLAVATRPAGVKIDRQMLDNPLARDGAYLGSRTLTFDDEAANTARVGDSGGSESRDLEKALVPDLVEDHARLAVRASGYEARTADAHAEYARAAQVSAHATSVRAAQDEVRAEPANAGAAQASARSAAVRVPQDEPRAERAHAGAQAAAHSAALRVAHDELRAERANAAAGQAAATQAASHSAAVRAAQDELRAERASAGAAQAAATHAEREAARAQLAQAQQRLQALRAEQAVVEQRLAHARGRVIGNIRTPSLYEGDVRDRWPPPDAPPALSGELAEIERALATGDRPRALATARAWHDHEPGNVLALIGLGDALEANHEPGEAARIYGSIIDLYPRRADLLRFAGERLERVGGDARVVALLAYRRAVEDRPDHLTGHRLYAYALWRAGRPDDAFAAILAGIDQSYPAGRFRAGDRVLAEDAGLLGAAWIAADPAQRARVTGELARRHLALPTGPSTRFILYWETDANDVDLHVQDARGGHAWYSSPHLPSGGELYADVTTGYGPECFAIAGTPHAGPYRLSIHYYAQGPMGYGMGLLQIVRYDGKGTLAFDDRPYVIMADHATVDLGRYDQPTQ